MPADRTSAVRPLLMSGPMVRATWREIAAPGTGKTQTRRLPRRTGRHRPSLLNDDWADSYVLDPGNADWLADELGWRPGDLAWVRETWAPLDRCTTNDPGVQALADGGFYRADNSTVEGEISHWSPAIHMPRRASRITLLIEDVRAQRLLDISEEDARAEGFADGPLGDPMPPRDIGCGVTISSPGGWASAAGHFQVYWTHLHPDWDGYSSPWIVALTYRPIARNIEDYLRALEEAPDAKRSAL